MTSGTTLEKEEIERIFLGFAIEAEKQLLENIYEPKQRVIVLAGPTAAGKSEFAVDLAKKIGGEIISADSMQVYRGMDIGTAKITPTEIDSVPHYLIDIRDVKDTFNVVDFYYEARHCCKQILSRNRVPIIVGGTGFYIHSVIYGPPSGPPSVPELRKYLEDELAEIGIEAMFDKLKDLDPEYAASITKNDKQKVVRALEILRLTGEKVSSLSWKDRRQPQNYDFRCWFLNRPKELLYERINKRCDNMVAKGFLDEVRRMDKEGIRENSSAAQAIGYRQALDFLDTEQTKADFDFFLEKFKKASRHYAKRQFTWFRREKAFRWLDLELHDYEVAMEMVIQDYNQTS
ncbi:MAG: tRNA (adenosine(37)-N6)-dimethylallyltransferase MiaA [Chlamydiota bacterium]